MDILDILIARKQSFTAETERLTKQAKKAMQDANSVISQVSAIESAATTASELASGAAAEFDAMKADITSAAAELVDDAIDDKIANLNYNAITGLTFIDNNSSATKIKQANVTKNDTTTPYNIVKNYTTTGENEDGSMTQKAITSALSNLSTRIEQIIINGGGSGGGNSGGGNEGDEGGGTNPNPNPNPNISSDDEGSIIIVDESGNIVPSSITEADIILAQIIAGTYNNDNIVGLEINYSSKNYERLQGAVDLTPGSDFDKFKMYGGRKRCIVDAEGKIIRFLNNNDTLSSIENMRVMVYQPAFYYLRVPLSVTKSYNGIKINKEHIYLSDTRYAGFMLHPIFRDANGNPLTHVLLPAFESSSYNPTTNTYEKSDTQNINLQNDCLISAGGAKPISGETQEFTFSAAKKMAENNGTGWSLTNLKFESMNQMLMAVEFGSLNMQNAFNKGLTELPRVLNKNFACNTGSTLSLGNTSGQALMSTNTVDNTTSSYTAEGQTAISYRGMENPFGSMWRFIDGISVTNDTVSYNEQIVDFKIPTKENWIYKFGYDGNYNWIYLPTEISANANSILPVGDYFYPTVDKYTNYNLIIGGFSTSSTLAGIFYYACNTVKDTFHGPNTSARIMFTPAADDTYNYNLWYNSLT